MEMVFRVVKTLARLVRQRAQPVAPSPAISAFLLFTLDLWRQYEENH
jgi:hypothetical protein